LLNRILIFILLSSLSYSYTRLNIVGSSTVYPFSSAIAEELSSLGDFKTPIVESTGSGGGVKLFCKNNSLKSVSITNASRKMKISEFQRCKANKVVNITEAKIGYDGIVIAQKKSNKEFSITRYQLFLALAAKVPSKDGKMLIKNPYSKWNQIDKSLPNHKITIYGPPTSSGTRDAIEEFVLKNESKKLAIYKKLGYKKYHEVRKDGKFVPSGENDNLIIKKLDKNNKAIGIFGYSFLIENENILAAIKVDGVYPSIENISSGEYPLSRSLFFYIKTDHIQKIKSLQSYIDLFMDKSMIGNDGYLSELGLIPLNEDKLNNAIKNVKSSKQLTINDLKGH